MVLKKAQDSAPRAADAARYARAREDATETYIKGAGRRGPRLFNNKYFKDVSREFDEFQVNTHLCKLLFWCEYRIDNDAKSCLCRANCPALCCVLVHVTF